MVVSKRRALYRKTGRHILAGDLNYTAAKAKKKALVTVSLLQKFWYSY